MSKQKSNSKKNGHVPCFAINVKLTPTELMLLDACMKMKTLRSRSGALRTGMNLLFEYCGVKQEHLSQIDRERRLHPPRHNKVSDYVDANLPKIVTEKPKKPRA